ncbi:hypothetical protein, partial [Bacteroides uniformis]
VTMERAIITISENGKVNIPRGNVWMSEMELVELFGVIAPTLRVAIKAIYKSGTLCPVSTQRCDLATPASWATFYNLEVVIALAFRLNTYEASRIRQRVLEALCQRKESEISILLSLESIGHQISPKGHC